MIAILPLVNIILSFFLASPLKITIFIPIFVIVLKKHVKISTCTAQHVLAQGVYARTQDGFSDWSVLGRGFWLVEGTGSFHQLGGSLLRSSRGKGVTSVETEAGKQWKQTEGEVNHTGGNSEKVLES